MREIKTKSNISIERRAEQLINGYKVVINDEVDFITQALKLDTDEDMLNHLEEVLGRKANVIFRKIPAQNQSETLKMIDKQT